MTEENFNDNLGSLYKTGNCTLIKTESNTAMKVIINGVAKGEVQPNEDGISTFPVEWLTDTSKCEKTTVSVEVDVSEKGE